jgi:hypothetical protein
LVGVLDINIHGGGCASIEHRGFGSELEMTVSTVSRLSWIAESRRRGMIELRAAF